MADVEAVGEITATAWRDRLVGILPDAVLQSLRADDLALVWAGSLVNPPTSLHRLLVAVEDDQVVGYAAVGPSSDPDCDPGTAELLALEIAPAHQRFGHGSRLLSASVDVARSAGAQTLTVWCPLRDEVRRAFLQSAGWGPDTALRDLATGDPDQPDGLLREARLATDIRLES